MATLDHTVGNYSYPYARGLARVFAFQELFDPAAKGVLAQNDVAQLIKIPANTWVFGVRWQVTKVEGAARNFAIGDGANTSGWIASTSANALATGYSGPVALTEGAPNTVTGFSAGKFYSADDTLDVLAPTAGGLTTCQIKVAALAADLNFAI